jgi:hypothetical protein
VANRIVNGEQKTITWHVDDVKLSHKDSKVNDEFYVWLQRMYGDEKIASFKAKIGNVHEYLGTKLDYTTPGEVKIDMKSNIEGIITEFPDELPESIRKCPWNDDLFKINWNVKPLTNEKARLFRERGVIFNQQLLSYLHA